nr:5-carboxymethyl-2-hydroxymuconate Delta-isomerase [uncultured Cohaesibacter sp.]
MPHMVISYAKPLEAEMEIKPLVETVWNVAEKSGLFTPAAIKSRALPVEHFVTGGSDKLFVHVEAKMFAGRTTEQKKALTKSLFDAITAMVGSQVAVSVEAIDMDKESYTKS